MDDPPAAAGEFDALREYLLDQCSRCIRPPVDRFRHPWLAPMPLSPAAGAYLATRKAGLGMQAGGIPGGGLGAPGTGDGFTAGDYGLGLFHHDASEAAIEQLLHAALREPALGSLLCLLDCAASTGCVHRTELPHKARENEPAKPVIAQYALRAVQALGADGPGWAERHRVYPRVARFLRYLEDHYTGLHGLMVTHSALQSGFDSDVLTAQLPDRTVEGPDTSAFMVLEYRAAGILAAALGRDADAREYEARAEALAALIESLLWYEDARGGFYVALRWEHGVGSLEGEVVQMKGPDGAMRPVESWACLLPLYAGIPSPDRAARMMARLRDPAGYWSPMGVRTAPRWDDFFHQAPRVLLYDHKKLRRGPVSNWSGPVWVLGNYYMATGLARYGEMDAARSLALRTARLLARDLRETGMLHECYDDAGAGLWPRRGTFVSWNVLALTLLRQYAEAPRTTAPQGAGG